MSVDLVDGAETVEGFGNHMFRSDNAAKLMILWTQGS
jgi:hypothetical protein